MFAFMVIAGILGVMLGLAYDRHVHRSEQQQKKQLISRFVDSCIADGTLYPVTPPGYGPCGNLNSSACRAGINLKIDTQEAFNLMRSELKRRGLPLDDPS